MKKKTINIDRTMDDSAFREDDEEEEEFEDSRQSALWRNE